MALCGTTAILLALGNTAFAEVTGADVWNNWKSLAQGTGQTFTPGSEVQSGDTLTISDIQIGMDTPEVSIAGTIGDITFVDQADGSVVMTMSPSYTMTITSADGGDDVEAVITVAQPDISMVASGGDGVVTYDFTAPSISMSVTSLIVDGEPVEIVAGLSMTDTAGSYVVTEGDVPEMDSGMTVGNMLVSIDMKEPEGGEGTLVASFDLTDVAIESLGALMFSADPEEMMALMAAGASTAVKMTHGAQVFNIDFQDRSGAFAASGTAETGLLDVAVSNEAISYALGTTELDFTMSGADIPLPEISASIGEIGFSVLVPASASEEPKDYALNITLSDLSVSDMIWGMIDPAAQLPRTPATLIIDAVGTASLLFDLFNPESMMALEADLPVELETLNINQIVLDIAGAALTGNGAFTFDNTDLTTFDGMPAPTGSIDLKLVGANALIDKLVGMGLLPEEQAMMGRMMMGMFARPEGEDTLTSKIEINGAEGSISANGQRLQ
jgi:hypothetical protein